MNHADFLQLSQAERDAAYNNTAAVATSAAQLQDFEARSAQLAKQPGAQLDQTYGALARQQFDFFPNQPGADTLLFIHGGYWQMRHKNGFRFVAQGALAQGLNAALIGYTLAPAASLQDIVAQVHAGISAVSAHAKNQGHSGHIHLCGWSAGGHLTAMAMAHPAVMTGLGISGIYDLEPIRHTYLNTALQLDETAARALSPLHLPVQPTKRFVTAYGTAELAALQSQSQAFAAYAAGPLVPVEGADHFSILNALAAPDGALLRAWLLNQTA